ncbi:MAG: hypothetical protein RMM06_07315 [Armatimonadota bacterium]|nr:phage protease [bacterium]MCS7310620.1 phage protease [Armatimonadota bacterium]MDW8105733.1 hypothetical protein [Armatimonadota bacterium]MDW8290518.1 hypothetical protein [Armatimonadota bacterium]
MEVEREAKLFEAGSYPDKGLEVSEEQLQSLVDGFTSPVPLVVEHLSERWQIGQLKALWRRGKELFGRLSLLPEAEALLKRLGIRGISVAVTPDVKRLVEVSVTATPRVADARLLSAGAVAFSGEILWTEVGAMEQEIEALRQRAEAAEFALRERQVEERLQRWLQQGKLTPAVREMARTLLLQGTQVVTFAGGNASVAEIFARLVEALPPVILFGERAPVPSEAESELSAEEEAFLRKHWGDLPWERIREHLSRGRRR